MTSTWLTKVATLARKEALSSDGASKYFVTISRRTCLRRLHLSGCFVKPDRCFEVVHLDQVNSDDFDTVCQGCKKRMLTECGKEQGDESSWTASSTSTASGSDAGEGGPIRGTNVIAAVRTVAKVGVETPEVFCRSFLLFCLLGSFCSGFLGVEVGFHFNF